MASASGTALTTTPAMVPASGGGAIVDVTVPSGAVSGDTVAITGQDEAQHGTATPTLTIAVQYRPPSDQRARIALPRSWLAIIIGAPEACGKSRDGLSSGPRGGACRWRWSNARSAAPPTNLVGRACSSSL